MVLEHVKLQSLSRQEDNVKNHWAFLGRHDEIVFAL